jgi:hypothetical protein
LLYARLLSYLNAALYFLPLAQQLALCLQFQLRSIDCIDLLNFLFFVFYLQYVILSVATTTQLVENFG